MCACSCVSSGTCATGYRRYTATTPSEPGFLASHADCPALLYDSLIAMRRCRVLVLSMSLSSEAADLSCLKILSRPLTFASSTGQPVATFAKGHRHDEGRKVSVRPREVAKLPASVASSSLDLTQFNAADTSLVLHHAARDRPRSCFYCIEPDAERGGHPQSLVALHQSGYVVGLEALAILVVLVHHFLDHFVLVVGKGGARHRKAVRAIMPKRGFTRLVSMPNSCSHSEHG